MNDADDEWENESEEIENLSSVLPKIETCVSALRGRRPRGHASVLFPAEKHFPFPFSETVCYIHIVTFSEIVVTRINVVPPSELSNKHLVAEHYELPRVFTLVRRAIARGQTADKVKSRQVPDYVLGPGHVTFFYTRLGYLVERFGAIQAEMRKRGFSPSAELKTTAIGSEWYGGFTPTDSNLAANRQRRAERSKPRRTAT